MIEANEMFRSLGYKIDERKDYIVYFKCLKFGRENQIEFNFKFKTIEKRRIPKLEPLPIGLKELQAINKKCQELGWIEHTEKLANRKYKFELPIISMGVNANLLQNSIKEHNNLTENVIKLQTVSGYTIENLIDLFAKGCTLNNYDIGIDFSFDDYVSKKAIREKMNREKMLTIFYGRQNGRSIEQEIRIAKIKAYEELLGEY